MLVQTRHYIKQAINLSKQCNILGVFKHRPQVFLVSNKQQFKLLSIQNGRVLAKQQTQLSEDVEIPAGALTTGEKVKQAGKDASYVGVLLLGFGVTGALIWYIASELLFSFSPNSVYSKALKMVKEDYKAIDAIGDSMKGYGEETSRGRRRHVSFQEYVVNDVNHMRIQFYVSGNNGKATVHAEAKETSRGSFEFRYIFLEMQTFPPRDPIIILDHR